MDTRKQERVCSHRKRVDQALKEGRKEDYNKNRNEEVKGNSQQLSEGTSSPEKGEEDGQNASSFVIVIWYSIIYRYIHICICIYIYIYLYK